MPVVDIGQVTDFRPFGAPLGTERVNPSYELWTTTGTAMIRAASAGVVVNVQPNPAPETDFEIHLRPSSTSIYLLVYDHIVGPQVTSGQAVAAGQTLGQIAPFNDPGHSRNGRVELQINRGAGADTVAVCPRDFGTAEFNAAHDAALAMFPARGSIVCVTATVKP